MFNIPVTTTAPQNSDLCTQGINDLILTASVSNSIWTKWGRQRAEAVTIFQLGIVRKLYKHVQAKPKAYLTDKITLAGIPISSSSNKIYFFILQATHNQVCSSTTVLKSWSKKKHYPALFTTSLLESLLNNTRLS